MASGTGNFAVWFLGQDASHGFQLAWIGNATPGNGVAQINTSGYTNAITFDGSAISFQTASGGSLGFGTTATVATFNGTTASTTTLTGSLINKGGFGNSGAIYGGAEITTGTTVVASLPTCNAARKGARHFVTDATAPAYNTTRKSRCLPVSPKGCTLRALRAAHTLAFPGILDHACLENRDGGKE
jgi:hypothetical protein